MATTTTKETAVKNEERRVELYIPRGQANDEPNLIIGINGVMHVLPKGKKSMVTPEVAYEYERSIKAQEKLDARIDEMLEAAKTIKGA